MFTGFSEGFQLILLFSWRLFERFLSAPSRLGRQYNWRVMKVPAPVLLNMMDLFSLDLLNNKLGIFGVFSTRGDRGNTRGNICSIFHSFVKFFSLPFPILHSYFSIYPIWGKINILKITINLSIKSLPTLTFSPFSSADTNWF